MGTCLPFAQEVTAWVLSLNFAGTAVENDYFCLYMGGHESEKGKFESWLFLDVASKNEPFWPFFLWKWTEQAGGFISIRLGKGAMRYQRFSPTKVR